MRYFAQQYLLPGEQEQPEPEEEEEETVMDYHTALCGTGVSDSYIYA